MTHKTKAKKFITFQNSYFAVFIVITAWLYHIILVKIGGEVA